MLKSTFIYLYCAPLTPISEHKLRIQNIGSTVRSRICWYRALLVVSFLGCPGPNG